MLDGSAAIGVARAVFSIRKGIMSDRLYANIMLRLLALVHDVVLYVAVLMFATYDGDARLFDEVAVRIVRCDHGIPFVLVDAGVVHEVSSWSECWFSVFILQ